VSRAENHGQGKNLQMKSRVFSTNSPCRFLSSRGQYGLLYLLLAHHPPCQINRTFRIQVGDRILNICSRCLGQWIGFALVIIWSLNAIPIERGLGQSFLVFGLLPLPIAVDWSTQTLGLRESTNPLRALTGFLYGLGLGQYIVSLLSRDWLAVTTATSIFLCYMLVFWLVVSKPGIASNYLKPYEEFIREHFANDQPAQLSAVQARAAKRDNVSQSVKGGCPDG